MAAAAAEAADLSPKFDITAAKDRLKRGEVNGEVKGRDGKADSRCCYVNTTKASSNKKNTLLLFLQRLMFIFVGKCCCCLSQKINLQVLSAVRRGKRGEERMAAERRKKLLTRKTEREREREREREEITIIRAFSLFKLIRS